MLVITDQRALGVCRQGGFAGARQAEEDGSVDRVALGVVGRAVHRHDAFFGQHVVQKREDRLLVLARIFGAADQDQLAVEVQRDHRFRTTAVTLGVGVEGRAVDDGELGFELVQLVAIGATQQVTDEQVVPGQFRNHAHIQTVGRVGAAIQILNVVIVTLHVLQHVFVKNVELGRIHRRVVFPPDVRLDAGGFDDEFILGRTARVLAGLDQEGPALSKLALAAAQCGFDQSWLHQVVIDIAQPGDALIFQAACWVYPSSGHLFAPVAGPSVSPRRICFT